MTVYEDFVSKRTLRDRARGFVARHPFKLTFLSAWGVVFFVGEVILRYVVH